MVAHSTSSDNSQESQQIENPTQDQIYEVSDDKIFGYAEPKVEVVDQYQMQLYLDQAEESSSVSLLKNSLESAPAKIIAPISKSVL